MQMFFKEANRNVELIWISKDWLFYFFFHCYSSIKRNKSKQDYDMHAIVT